MTEAHREPPPLTHECHDHPRLLARRDSRRGQPRGAEPALPRAMGPGRSVPGRAPSSSVESSSPPHRRAPLGTAAARAAAPKATKVSTPPRAIFLLSSFERGGNSPKTGSPPPPPPPCFCDRRRPAGRELPDGPDGPGPLAGGRMALAGTPLRHSRRPVALFSRHDASAVLGDQSCAARCAVRRGAEGG